MRCDFLDLLDGLGTAGIYGANLGVSRNEPFVISHDVNAIEAHSQNIPAIQIITENQFEKGLFDITKPFFIELECNNYSKRRRK